MAKNEITVNITANTAQFDRSLQTLREKLREAMGVSGFSLAEINPFKIASDWIRGTLQSIAQAFMSYRADMAKAGEALGRQAETLGATAGEYTRLAEAAERAGIGQKVFADALAAIKAGNATLDETAAKWERIAAATGQANANVSQRTRVWQIRERLAGMDAGGLSLPQWLAAQVTGDWQAAQALQDLMGQVNAGRGTLFSPGEVMDRVWGQGVRERPWGQVSEDRVRAIVAILNDEVAARLRRAEEARQAEAAAAEKAAEASRRAAEAQEAAAYAAEDKARAEEAAAEAKAQAGVDATARKVAGDYARLTKSGSTPVEALAVLAEAYGTTPGAISRALARGQALLRDPVTEAVARNEERAAAEAKAKAEREALLAQRKDAQERVAGLRDALAGTGGDLTAQLFGAGGGSLVGAGSFTLAMAERLRAIDRADAQAAIREDLAKAVEELKGINAKLEE